MSDLKSLKNLLAKIDVWVMADEALQTLSLEERHGLTTQDTFWNTNLDGGDGDDSATLSSSTNIRIDGNYGLRWSLTLVVEEKTARILAELWLDHSVPYLIREIFCREGLSQESLIGFVEEARKWLVDDFVEAIKNERMADLYERYQLEASQL